MSDSSAQAFPAVFVRQVEDLLEPEARRTLEKLRYPSAPSSESLVAFFLNELFARATPEIIRIKTPGEVAFIANSCCRVLRSLPSSPDRIALDLEQHAGLPHVRHVRKPARARRVPVMRSQQAVPPELFVAAVPRAPLFERWQRWQQWQRRGSGRERPCRR